MNHRLITAAEKLANKQRRNRKKALKLKLRRQKAFMASINPVDLLIGNYLLDPQEMLNLEYGSIKERRKALTLLRGAQIAGFCFDEDASDILMNRAVPASDMPFPTRQFVIKNDRLRVTKPVPFRLW